MTRSMPAAVALVVGIAVLMVLALTLLDDARVRQPEELASVGFGVPYDWVVQDQQIAPPMPHDAALLSPWEHPTDVRWLPLLFDVAVVGLVMAGAWAALRRLRRGGSPGSPGAQ